MVLEQESKGPERYEEPQSESNRLQRERSTERAAREEKNRESSKKTSEMNICLFSTDIIILLSRAY